jgi:hypothetical protein
MIATVILKNENSEWEAYFNVSSVETAESEINIELKRYNDFVLSTSYEQHNPQYDDKGNVITDESGNDVLDIQTIYKTSEPDNVRSIVNIIKVE